MRNSKRHAEQRPPGDCVLLLIWHFVVLFLVLVGWFFLTFMCVSLCTVVTFGLLLSSLLSLKFKQTERKSKRNFWKKKKKSKWLFWLNFSAFSCREGNDWSASGVRGVKVKLESRCLNAEKVYFILYLWWLLGRKSYNERLWNGSIWALLSNKVMYLRLFWFRACIWRCKANKFSSGNSRLASIPRWSWYSPNSYF